MLIYRTLVPCLGVFLAPGTKSWSMSRHSYQQLPCRWICGFFYAQIIFHANMVVACGVYHHNVRSLFGVYFP